MIYAQHRAGQKLHLAYEAGEGHYDIVRAGYISKPLCGKSVDGYRMIINVPLGNACRNCLRVYRARRR